MVAYRPINFRECCKAYLTSFSDLKIHENALDPSKIQLISETNILGDLPKCFLKEVLKELGDYREITLEELFGYGKSNADMNAQASRQ